MPAIAMPFERLIAHGDWAESALDTWLREHGPRVTEELSRRWGQATRRPFVGSYPYELQSWCELLIEASGWLADRWKEDIANGPWIAESKLFDMVRRSFGPIDVKRHAQPVWIAPQHFDIYVPSLRLAIEYMGKQHYEPVGIFGGEPGYQATVERDNRKRRQCQAAGIHLEEVRFDESLLEAVSRIAGKYLPRAEIGR